MTGVLRSLWVLAALAFRGPFLILVSLIKLASGKARLHEQGVDFDFVSESAAPHKAPKYSALHDREETTHAGPFSAAPNPALIEAHGDRLLPSVTLHSGPLFSGPMESAIHTERNTPIGHSLEPARKEILDLLPNDLTRLVYLASIRDCNTGAYFHPALSRHYDIALADRVLRLWHEEVFARLVAAPVSDYVQQLQSYIRFAGVERTTFVGTWQSLQAYRATLPVEATPLAANIFFLQVTTALWIVKSRTSSGLAST